jgi:hypothetical protein
MAHGVKLLVGDNDIRNVARSILTAIREEIGVKERILLSIQLPAYEDYLRHFSELMGCRKALQLAEQRAESLGLVTKPSGPD